jgi:hypothetical protein
MKCTPEQFDKCDCPLSRYGRCVNDRPVHKRIEDWAADVKRAWNKYQNDNDRRNELSNLKKLREAIEEEHGPA